MDDAASRKPEDTRSVSDDDELDEILRAVAHAPPRRPPAAPACPGDRWGAGGRYVIEQRLGRGGMGTVYAATDTLLHRTVALKVLDPSRAADDDAHRERLLREARIAARFEHERVARVYDVGEQEGTLFVAMELVRGTTLRSWMAGRSLSPAEILSVTRQIAEGLAALHAAGVFHRDLKPENVMLAESGGVRLLDFGLARHAQGGASLTDVPLVAGAPGQSESLPGFSGTPAYMAPEQWSGAPLDARVDVFALGIILHELCTGARPFDHHRGEPPEEPWPGPDLSGDAWAAMPPALREITARMLAPDPAQRLADGAAVLAALATADGAPTAPVPIVPKVVAPDIAHLSTEMAPVPARPRRRRAWISVGVIAAAAGAAAPLGVRAATLRHAAAPRSPALAGMAWIDAGTLTVGRSPEELDRACAAIGPGCRRDLLARESPAVRVTVPPFQLDVYEVTNEEMAGVFQEFRGMLVVSEDEEHHYPRYVRWNTGLGHDGEFLADLGPEKGGIEYRADQTYHARPGRERLPATQVSWYAARLYCTARGKRLPVEDEWEAAARGREDRPYPWGSAPVRCGEVVVPRDGLLPMPPECPEKVALAPVGTAAEDVTPEGIHDLAGNAAEWVDSVFVPGDRGARVDAGAGDRPKVLRGGSYAQSFMARTSGRKGLPPGGAGDNLGFRCALR